MRSVSWPLGGANSSIMTAMSFVKWRHYARARLFELLRRPDDAIREYEQALRAAPGFLKAANALGYRHALAGRHAEAIRYFGEAVRLDGRDAVAHYNLGYNYESNRQPREA